MTESYLGPYRVGTLQNAQAMATRESPRSTKLYDRTGDEITLDEVEWIRI
jgi:integrase/recombinase XerD